MANSGTAVELASPEVRHVGTEQTVAGAATSSTPRAAAGKTRNAAEGAALVVPVASEVASGMGDLGVATASTVQRVAVTSAERRV